MLYSLRFCKTALKHAGNEMLRVIMRHNSLACNTAPDTSPSRTKTRDSNFLCFILSCAEPVGEGLLAGCLLWCVAEKPYIFMMVLGAI